MREGGREGSVGEPQKIPCRRPSDVVGNVLAVAVQNRSSVPLDRLDSDAKKTPLPSRYPRVDSPLSIRFRESIGIGDFGMEPSG